MPHDKQVVDDVYTMMVIITSDLRSPVEIHSRKYYDGLSGGR